jgi:hypothetical protein
MVQNDPIHGAYQGWLTTATLSQIRLIVPVLLGLALAAWLTRLFLNRHRTDWDPLHRYLVLALVAGAGMTRLADPIWRWVPGFASVVFPWRLTLFLTLAASLLLAAALSDLARRSTALFSVATALALALAVVLSLRIAGTADWQTFTAAHAATPVVRLRVTGAMMPRSNPVMRGFRRRPAAGPARLLDVSGHSSAETVEVLREATQARSYQVKVPAGPGTLLLVPQFDYPGWSAWVDGRGTPVRQHPPFGTLAIPVPAGEHRVDLRFGATPVRRAAMAISILSVLLLAALTVYRDGRTMGGRRPV